MMPALEKRLRKAAKNVGGIRSLSEKSGVSERTIAHWLKGTEPKVRALTAVAVAAGVSVEWLITGAGEEKIVVDPVETRLAEIEAKLNQVNVPMSEDDSRNAPEWAKIRDELRLIAQDEEAGESQRGRADLILRLVFSDQGAAQRAKQKQTEIGDRLRRSRQVCDAAVQAVEWEPPRIVWEALRNAAFECNMRIEDAALLLEAIKSAVEDQN